LTSPCTCQPTTRVQAPQNKPARDLLRGKIDLHDRMVSPHALGHNKFLVICYNNDEPR
jgi:hypothetical protein